MQYLSNQPDVYEVPETPVPHLTPSDSGLPSVNELEAIYAAIDQAEHNRQALDDEVVALQARLTKLEVQRKELSTIISTHLGIASTLRQLPADVLIEIFLCCMPAEKPAMKIVMALSAVCHYWQDIIQAVPAFWTHFKLVRIRTLGLREDPTQSKCIQLQLQRSSSASLSFTIHAFDTRRNNPGLQWVSDTAHRWRYLSLQYAFDRIILSEVVPSAGFTALQTLEISVRQGNQFNTDNWVFTQMFPALQELSLDLGGENSVPAQIHSILPQLKSLSLTHPLLEDLATLFPLFSVRMQLVLVAKDTGSMYSDGNALPLGTRTRIRTLILDCAHDTSLPDRILSSLAAPNLLSLTILSRWYSVSREKLQQFLQQSRCVLQHATLPLGSLMTVTVYDENGLPSSKQSIWEFLTMPELQSLLALHIDISNGNRRFLGEVLHCLTIEDQVVLASMHSLSISGHVNMEEFGDIHLERLLQRSKYSQLRNLSLITSFKDHSFLNKLSATALQACRTQGLIVETFSKPHEG